VELMIVIVIVGVLSTVALPNFLNQTTKAKLSEADTLSSAYLKLWNTENMVGDGDTLAKNDCPQETDDFIFTCGTSTTGVPGTVVVTATQGGSFTTGSITYSINSDTNKVENNKGDTTNGTTYVKFE
jgi:type IV pilus assembly protein PilA